MNTKGLPLMIRTLAVTLLLSLLLLSGRVAHAQEEPPAPQTLDELEGRLSAIMTERNVPGAAVILVSGDAVLWEGYLGVADVERDSPVTGETQFRIGSISKSFVALTALQLQEDGQLDLNTPLSELAPDLAIDNPWAATEPVRFVHLLEHTAGLPNLRYRHYLINDGTISTEAGLATTRALHRSMWRPGSYGMYSNIGPAMAAYAIEQVTGEQYETLVEERFFDPLGMTSASFYVDEANRPQLATSYAPDGQTVQPPVNIIVRASGSITVEPRQMAPFMQMLLNDGNYQGQALLNPDSIARMRRAETSLAAQNGVEVAYGLATYATERDGFTFYGHNGGIDGFLSEYALLPDQERGYFININSANGLALGEMIDAIEAYLIHDLTPPTAAAAIALSDAERDALVGSYELTTPLLDPLVRPLERTIGQVRVTEQGDELMVSSLLSPPVTLIPVAPRQFRSEDGRGISYVFVDDPEYGRVLQSGVGLNARQISSAQSWLRIGLLIAFLVSTVMTLLFAAVWLTRLLLRRLYAPRLSVRVLPLLATLSLIGMLVAFVLAALSSNPTQTLGTPSLPSLAITVLTVAFALFSVVGFIQAVRGLRWPIPWGVKFYALFASSMNLIMTVAMGAWGLVGYMPWR